jgi:hypothetical protein
MIPPNSHDWASPKIALIHIIDVECNAGRGFYRLAMGAPFASRLQRPKIAILFVRSPRRDKKGNQFMAEVLLGPSPQ